MQMTYLILHKVRGEPAFDIAERCCPGPRPCQPNCGCWDGERCSAEGEWIIPTSGHKAYPYEVWEISKIPECLGDIHGIRLHTDFTGWLEDEPDHYRCEAAPARKGNGQKLNIGAILSNLLPKVHRRF